MDPTRVNIVFTGLTGGGFTRYEPTKQEVPQTRTNTASSSLLQCTFMNYRALFRLCCCSQTTFPGAVSSVAEVAAETSDSFPCCLIGGSLFPSGLWGSTQQGRAQLL